VNDEAFKNWSSNAHEQPTGAATMDAESFMAAMEVDCRERTERRKQAECVAERLKLAGNEAFNASDYVKSVELYTEALSHVRHWTVLYTNRAQAHLRLDNFDVRWFDSFSLAACHLPSLSLCYCVYTFNFAVFIMCTLCSASVFTYHV